MNPNPEDIEVELGVPFPGNILPPEQWARTAIKKLPAHEPLNWATTFGRDALKILEIGCGNGRFIISSALRRPECDHIGIDVLPMVIRYATRRANQRGLSNARLAVCGGLEFLNCHTTTGSLHEIHIYHPQPYREPHQQHKRLLHPNFLGLMIDRLSANGCVFLQTDNPGYWDYFMEVMPKFFRWQTQAGIWNEDPLGRSRREIIATQKGLPIFRGYGIRRDDLSTDQIQSELDRLPAPSFHVDQPKNRTGWKRPRSR